MAGMNGSPQEQTNFIVSFRKHMKYKAFGNELCVDFALSEHFKLRFKINFTYRS